MMKLANMELCRGLEVTPMDQVDADIGNIFQKLDAWLDGFFKLLPNIGIAIVVLLLFIGLGIMVGRIIHSRAVKNDRDSLGEVASSLVRWTLFEPSA
jgi:small conductance mechanosensitive channel